MWFVNPYQALQVDRRPLSRGRADASLGLLGDPGEQARASSEAAETGEAVDIRLLHHVFGLAGVLNQQASDAIEPLAGPLHDGAKSVGVALLYTLKERHITKRNQIGQVCCIFDPLALHIQCGEALLRGQTMLTAKNSSTRVSINPASRLRLVPRSLQRSVPVSS